MKKILCIAAILSCFAFPVLASEEECQAQTQLAEQVVLARDNGITFDHLTILMLQNIGNPIVMDLFTDLASVGYADKDLTAKQIAEKVGWYCLKP